MRTLTLLGPQRLEPNIAAAIERLGVSGRLAAVTAGWQEREGEVEELSEHLGLPVADLMLHARCEQAFAEDPELFQAHRARQDRLRKLQRLYRYRLDFAIQPARELLRRRGDAELLDPQREAAIAAVRRLDEEHLERIAEVHRDFERAHPLERYAALERQRSEIGQLLADCSALVIAGGHVAVLLNRLRLFRVAELLGDLVVIAWSAGAMALAERIVLFHDSPPQGAGSAEVLERGLGLLRGFLPLPHARRRLTLDDRCRVALLARRFAPAVPLPLDPGVAITLDGERAPSGPRAFGATPAQRLTAEGRVVGLEAA